MGEERDQIRQLKQELRLKKMRARLREKHTRELARLDRIEERSLGRRRIGKGKEEAEER